MAAFPNSTATPKFPSLSRRNMMRGLAAGLIGASVPVAAIAGLTARRLTTDADAKIYALCDAWHERRKVMRRMEKELRRLHEDVQARTPPLPAEMFAPIQIHAALVRSPGDYNDAGRRDRPKAWTQIRLEHFIAGHAGEPTPECREHCQKLLTVLDEHKAVEKKISAPYARLDKEWEREAAKHWRQYAQLIRIKADTIQGVAAQIKVAIADGSMVSSSCEENDAFIVSLMTCMQRLAAAQTVGV